MVKSLRDCITAVLEESFVKSILILQIFLTIIGIAGIKCNS